ELFDSYTNAIVVKTIGILHNRLNTLCSHSLLLLIKLEQSHSKFIRPIVLRIPLKKKVPRTKESLRKYNMLCLSLSAPKCMHCVGCVHCRFAKGDFFGTMHQTGD